MALKAFAQNGGITLWFWVCGYFLIDLY